MTALAAPAAATGGRLDYLKDIWEVGAGETAPVTQDAYEDAKSVLYGCRRTPLRYVLQRGDGFRVAVRCKSPNKCADCARRAALENAEMLALDAREGNAPTLWIVLTTRSPSWNQRYASRRALLDAIKRRYPAAEVATVTEFTTGGGDGIRRPHWNILLKNVPAQGADFVRQKVAEVWCAREDALPQGQAVTEVTGMEGLARYLSLHFYKESQQPPEGWSGHRFTTSRGFFGDKTRAQARQAASQSRRRRARILLAESAGMDRQEAENFADDKADDDNSEEWSVIQLDAIEVMRRNDEVLAAIPRQRSRRPKARRPRGVPFSVERQKFRPAKVYNDRTNRACGNKPAGFHNINYRALRENRGGARLQDVIRRRLCARPPPIASASRCAAF